MNAQTLITLAVTGGGIAAVVWVLNKIGRALAAVLEALATLAVIFVALWLAVKITFGLVRWVVQHWRTTLGLVLVGTWAWWWGWLPVVVTVVVVAVWLLVWRWRHRASFEAWAGGRVRSWWLRWTVYAPRLPKWLHNCGLTIHQHERPVVLTANPLGRNKFRRQAKPPTSQVPRVLEVRSGASWDEVRVRLVPGQKPEDFDEAARALATARGVARCQVRELKPRVVSIDFQRRNLLGDTVWCRDLAELADVDGTDVDLRRVWSGRTDYGTDWHPGEPRETPCTSPPSSTGGGKTCAASSAGMSSTSPPSNPRNGSPHTCTPRSAVPSRTECCARSPPPPTTRSGGQPTTN